MSNLPAPYSLIFKPFVIHSEGDWEIILQQKHTKCGWMHVYLSTPGGETYAERYDLVFNLMHRLVEWNDDWERLWTTRRDMAFWFIERMDRRFPACEFCNEMWRREGCP